MQDSFVSGNPQIKPLISDEILDKVNRYFKTGKRRVDIAKAVSDNVSMLVSIAHRRLACYCDNINDDPGANSSVKYFPSCFRDLELFVRSVLYAFIAKDSQAFEMTVMGQMKEIYASLDIPTSRIAKAIEITKTTTLEFMAFQTCTSYHDKAELSLSQIRQLYPDEWVCVDVQRFDGPNPSSCILLSHNPDLSSLSVNQYADAKHLYTFFTGPVNKPHIKSSFAYQPQEFPKTELYGTSSTFDDELLGELSLYFNCLMSLFCS